MSDINTLQDVATYLRTCRVRILCTGNLAFEPLSIERSSQVKDFFYDHQDLHVGVMSGTNFLGFTAANLNRINAQLPEHQQVDISKLPCIDMRKKYARRKADAEMRDRYAVLATAGQGVGI